MHLMPEHKVKTGESNTLLSLQNNNEAKRIRLLAFSLVINIDITDMDNATFCRGHGFLEDPFFTSIHSFIWLVGSAEQRVTEEQDCALPLAESEFVVAHYTYALVRFG